MKFTKASAHDHLYGRMVSENNMIEIGVHPVIYGYRVRAGFTGDISYMIDYCCGDKQSDIEFIYAIVKNILEGREEREDAFSGFPFMNIKPFFNDDKFMKTLTALADENLEPVTIEPVSTFREIMYKELGLL